MTGVVSTIKEKCKRCYTCVRECPSKAIKVEGGQAVVISERCISCGNCIKVCGQQAKHVADSIEPVKKLLAGPDPVFACLAPSFPAAFHPVSPGKAIAAIRKLGFKEVWEVAFGAELVGKVYLSLYEEAHEQGKRIITSACPAIVSYIEKYMPSLIGSLAKVVSPMIAIGRAIHKKCGQNVKVVFIGPCIAKKNEIRDTCVADAVAEVLTYKELDELLANGGITPGKLRESGFDGPRARLARSFPISGGLLKTSGLSADILENDVLVTEGKDRALDALREMHNGQSNAEFFDILYCEGCISGPKMPDGLSVLVRKEIIADYVNRYSPYTSQREHTETIEEYKDIDLSRSFAPQNVVLPKPSDQQIEKALRSMKKLTPQDQLNCGACGYQTCLEKAIAVCQGLAEAEMCLPYLVDELEETCVNLQESHKALETAQQRLVQTERLASMGQLSAGVAHEINNPLGTILLFSNMMMKGLEKEHPRRADLQMIVNEATRCKNIVRGLLDFARQSRVNKVPSDVKVLMDAVRAIFANKATVAGVEVTAASEGQIPVMMLDASQIQQMLVNLVDNAIDATPRGGRVSLTARPQGTAEVKIEVRDTGCGISKENLSRLFTPFFTTKEMGKGTGLGLAICYGIVKMHSGDISVQSEVGKGAVFTVSLPVGTGEGTAPEAAQSSKAELDSKRKKGAV